MLMLSSPKVTIGVASYNNSNYILQTLDSIKFQTYSNIELVIIDDCSKDDSVEKINKWLPSCKYPASLIINRKNLGVTKVCNILLKSASPSSKYFILIGSDDLMHQDRVEVQVNLMESERNVAFAFSDMQVIDKENKTVNPSYFNVIQETYSSLNNFKALSVNNKIEYLIGKNVFPSPAMIYKKDVLLQVGGWDEDLYFEDWDMCLKLIFKGFDFSFGMDTLVSYRILASSINRTPSPKYLDTYLKMISKYKGLTTAIDSSIKNQVVGKALEIYKLNGSTSSYWLTQAFLHSRKLRLIILIILSSFKVPYSLPQSINNYLRKISSLNKEL